MVARDAFSSLQLRRSLRAAAPLAVGRRSPALVTPLLLIALLALRRRARSPALINNRLLYAPMMRAASVLIAGFVLSSAGCKRSSATSTPAASASTTDGGSSTAPTLQFLVSVPYVAGKTVSLATLRKPNPEAKSPEAFLGNVSLLDVTSKALASSYGGTVEIVAAPTEEQALAHVKVDLRADAVTLRGELDALVCLYE